MRNLPAIQRVLFRMQHDASFAARLRAGEPGAVTSAGLDPGDLDLLLEAPVAGVEADPGGKRLAQLLRNVSGELALTLARLSQLGDGESLSAHALATFPRSEAFHRCVMQDGRLPLAFAAHAADAAARSGDALALGLARIEHAMARLRRFDVTRPQPAPGAWVLAAHAQALAVAAGSTEAAARLRSALDAGQALPSLDDLAVSAAGSEHVLIVGSGSVSSLRLREVAIEQLAELAGELLVLADQPVTAGALAAFGARHDVSAGDLGEFIDSLRADGLVRES